MNILTSQQLRISLRNQLLRRGISTQTLPSQIDSLTTNNNSIRTISRNLFGHSYTLIHHITIHHTIHQSPFTRFLGFQHTARQCHFHGSLFAHHAGDTGQCSCYGDDTAFHLWEGECCSSGCEDHVGVDGHFAAAAEADAVYGCENGFATFTAGETTKS